MIGARLDKWIIDRELGRGGMGRVYLAHEATSDRLAAVKVLSAELAQDTGFLHRFQREIEVLSQLQHPNIVQFYESGSQNEIFYFAMEYVAGANFEQLLHEHGRLPWQEVVDAALQVCPALKHAHDRGIIHRDIKPPNLLRNPEGVIKLTDFGIAKVFAAPHLTSTGGVVGTADFLSPEQAVGKQATKRSDLYSLGVVLYNVLTGKQPFTGESSAELLHKHLYGQFDRPQKLVPEIPHELDEVVCRLLEKDPARRPGDALVLQRQLESVRRKIERRAQLSQRGELEEKTAADTSVADSLRDAPGPSTMMSQMVREELIRQNRGSTFKQWLNRPWVLVPLFLLCVALITWGFWPSSSRSAQELYEEGSALMRGKDPRDWEKAWSDYLEPLSRLDPDYHRDEVENWRQQAQDAPALLRALAGVKPHGEAQRLYQRGLRLCAEGDIAAAKRTWQNLARVFDGVEKDKHWVVMAQAGSDRLADKPAPAEESERTIKQALDRAKKLRDSGDKTRAEQIERGLHELYPNNPALKAKAKTAGAGGAP